MDDDALGRAEIHYLACLVTDGTATPSDARRLLVEFVRQAARPKDVDERLIEHARDCIAAYLDGRRDLNVFEATLEQRHIAVPTLNKAFGIFRAMTGRPKITEDERAAVAATVLAELLEGKSLEDATAALANLRKAEATSLTSDTQVADAWAAHKLDALLYLRIARASEDEAWSPAEMDRLRQIYRDVPGAVLPGETPFEGRHHLP